MANPRKKHRKAAKRGKRTVASHRSRAQNPAKRRTRRARKNAVVIIRRARKNPKLRIGRRRSRRNPAIFGESFGLLKDGLFLAGGGIGARSIPQIVASGANSGALGYGMNLLSAAVLAWFARKWKGDQAGKMTLLGGVMFTLARAIDDVTGYQIVNFAAVRPGQVPMLQGDAHYGMGLAGIFKNMDFVLPSNSYASLQRPAAAIAAAPAGGGPVAMVPVKRGSAAIMSGTQRAWGNGGM